MFTDKDLKHYTEVVSWAQGDACISIPFEVLRALFTRLKAAENVCEAVGSMCLDSCCDVYALKEKWYKAVGK